MMPLDVTILPDNSDSGEKQFLGPCESEGAGLNEESASGTAMDAVYALMKERMLEAMDYLTVMEQEVLRYRFGLDGGEPMTVEQTASKTGVTPDFVRNRQVRAMRRICFPEHRIHRDYLD